MAYLLGNVSRKFAQMQFHSSAIIKYGFGGSVREAGGAFGDREKAKEDQYFYNLQKDQFKRMKEESKKKLKYHKDQIKKHEAAIREEEEKFKDKQG